MQQITRIAPSILSANFAALGAEVRAISDAGADYIHLDVMDGHFVPNLTIGPDVIASLRIYSDLPFDVHLMISPIDSYISAFVAAGADIITVHTEAGVHIHRTVELIKDQGVRAGVALNPGTTISAVEPLLEDVDLVLVMSVNPGFGGQSFIKGQLEKIRQLRMLIDATGRKIDLQIDGGINSKNAQDAVAAGADVLVAGTAAFIGGPECYASNIDALRVTSK